MNPLTRREYLLRSLSVGVAVVGGWGIKKTFKLLGRSPHNIDASSGGVTSSPYAHYLKQRANRLFLNRHKRRKQYRKQVWSDIRLIANRNTGVVHWPHPGIFGRHHSTPPKVKEDHPAEQWRTLLGTMADESGASFGTKKQKLIRRLSKQGKNDIVPLHFSPRREAAIREAFALAALNIRPETFAVEGIENALRMLQPVLQWNTREEKNHRIKAMKQDWRTFTLYGRLVCLKHSDDWQAAHQELSDVISIAKVVDDPLNMVLRDLGIYKDTFIDTVKDSARFRKFHSKSVKLDASRNVFRKRLLSRVEQAKMIVMGVDSSSGKDTRQGERSSNLRSASLHSQLRKRSWWPRTRKFLRKKRKNLMARLDYTRHSRHARKSQDTAL